MTKEEALAFDLALEALESERPYLGPMPSKTVKAITAIKQARALDKMAENARELGLDYEPADGTQVSKVWWDGEKLMAKPIPLEDFYQPVQEPEIVQRVKRYAGQTMRTARNPNITARECIELANWLAANTTTPLAAPTEQKEN
jgi:hypothetical protein